MFVLLNGMLLFPLEGVSLYLLLEKSFVRFITWTVFSVTTSYGHSGMCIPFESNTSETKAAFPLDMCVRL